MSTIVKRTTSLDKPLVSRVHRPIRSVKYVGGIKRGRPIAVKSSPIKVQHGKPVLARVLRGKLQLSQPEFAKMLPLSVRTLATLESGTAPTEVVARRLVELQRLTNALSEVVKKETLGQWLQTPNQAFDGLKPLEVIDRGEIDRLWGMIYYLRSGVPA